MVQRTILRLPEVIAATGLARSTIYKAIKDGTFPASIPLGPRAVGWLSIHIDEWISQRISASRYQ